LPRGAEARPAPGGRAEDRSGNPAAPAGVGSAILLGWFHPPGRLASRPTANHDPRQRDLSSRTRIPRFLKEDMMNPRTDYPELDLKSFQDGAVDTRNPP